ncbi:MAG: dimethylarginine dimethylaminohydrolase family protein [Ilumatobacteraceae bacterium]
MTDRYGAHSTTAVLDRVAVRPPPAELAAADSDRWHYAAPIDLDAARREHAELVALLDASGAEVVVMDAEEDRLPDSVFTYDPSIVTRRGAVLFNMGKELRRPEADLHAEFYERLGIPVLDRVTAPGTIEGGDTLWIDDSTLAVGRGYRTNDAGIGQLTEILAAVDVEVVAFDLPVHHGRDACLHLMSLVSLCADDLALAHVPLLPVRLLQLLEARGYDIVGAPPDEFEASTGISCNVLATAPRRVIIGDGFPATEAALRAAGCMVDTFPCAELGGKAEGGPTCLTRPLLRGSSDHRGLSPMD